MQRNPVWLNIGEETDAYDRHSPERHTTPALLQDQGKIFGTLEGRVDSFKGLPVLFREKMPTVSDLAANGLYYTGQKDLCNCYECHASFRNLLKDDNIFVLHSSNHPTCAHVKQMIQSKLDKGTHNCISKSSFKGTTIQIDLHVIKIILDLFVGIYIEAQS